MRTAGLSIERPALYVVATPIGNLGDIGARAVAVLGAVDHILAEDTRHSRRLLDACAVTTPLSACHEHNEQRVAAETIERLVRGPEACALISDAGTPLVSDPGFVLVRAAIEAGVPVITVPGPSALVAALSIGGLATDRFAFEGFLPAAAAQRGRRLGELAHDPRTLVFYEAPHRLARSLAAMAEAFGGERAAVVARELTKRHESVYRGSLDALQQVVAAEPNAARGELVILVAGAPVSAADDAEVDRVLDVLLGELSPRQAVRIAVALTGRGRNEIYRRVLARDDRDH